MGAELSRRLGFEDAGFLYFEKPTAPLHVGSVGIYEGTIPFKALVAHLESRIHTIPRYRQRVSFVPLNLGHPTWEDDPAFDIRRHVRRYRARRPLDDTRLARLAAELFAPAMDRERPLWDVTLIEGLTGDRSALLARAHHCMVDGVSGVELLVALLDLTPAPREVDPPLEPWTPRPASAPSDMMADAMWDWLRQQVGTWADLQLMLLDPSQGRQRLLTLARAFQKGARFLLSPAPPTAINAPVAPARALAWTEMPFADLRAIRSSLGGTVNDVVLAILGGALSRYLTSDVNAADIPPEIRVLIPVNVRREDEQGTLGNRVSFMMAGIPMNVDDPLHRFNTIRDEVAGLKGAGQAEGLDLLAQILGQLPPPMAPFAASIPARVFTACNLVCTNVPGPMVPLYCVGHRMLAHYPLAPVSFELGLNVGVMSYDQRLFWGLVSNAKTVPQPAQLARRLDEAFVELREAVGVKPSDLPQIGARPSHEGEAPAAPEAAATEVAEQAASRRRDGQRPIEGAPTAAKPPGVRARR